MARAIILAAGFNERLRRDMPKALLPLGRATVLDRVASFLNHPEIRSLLVVHNARWARGFKAWKSTVCSAVADGPGARLPYIRLLSTGIKRVEDRRGAVADLEQALYHMPNGDPLVVMPGDTVCDWQLTDFLSGIDRRRPTIALAEVTSREAKDLGVVDIAPGGRIHAFGDLKPPIGDGFYPGFDHPRRPRVWLGPLWLPPDARHHVGMWCEERRQAGEMPDSLGDFISWLKDRVEVYGWLAPGRAWDVGTEDGYEAVRHG